MTRGPSADPQRAAALDVQDLAVALSGRAVLDGVSLSVPPGEILGVLGPNGSGKSTLLRAVLRVLGCQRGRMLLDGTDIARMTARERARQVAAVLQESTAEFDLRVREVATMGRAPHQRALAGDTARDRAIVDEALEAAGVGELADRPVTTLSGGERQRAVIARALAQRPALLVLDEPTNHLDIRHQIEVLTRVRDQACTTLIALHDLNLAAQHCDRVLLLDRGAPAALGTPREVLTPELIAEVYGVRATVVEHPESNAVQVVFTAQR